MGSQDAFWQKLLGGILATAVIGAYSWVWTVQGRIYVIEAEMARLQDGYEDVSSMQTDIALMKQDIRYMRERFDELTHGQ